MIRNTNGQQYFYLTSVDGRSITILSGWDYGHAPENDHFRTGNYFLSEDDAKRAAAQILSFLEEIQTI